MGKKPTNGFDKRPQDINRGGRPKKGLTVTDVLRSRADKQELVEKLLELALEKGDFTALRYAIDRMDGTPIQTVNQNLREMPKVVGYYADSQPTDSEDTDADSE